MLGMRPKAFRAGGAGRTIRFAIGECWLGSILVAVSEKGVCAIALGDEPQELARDLQDQFPNAQLIGGDANFEQLVAKVVGFLETPSLGLDLPLDIRGTAFQERVWQALRAIPPGSTVTYTDIAKRIGKSNSVRAVAQASPPTRSQSPSPAIASCAPTVRSPATAGESIERPACSSASEMATRSRQARPANQRSPPEIYSVSPVIHAASGDARNTTAGAMSCG